MEIQLFESNDFGQMRTITDDNGDPWFVAKDIAEVLGFSETNAMTRHLDADDVSEIAPAELTGTNSMARKFTIINESGFYSAILRSRRPEAKAFKKWVTGTVLPAIRKTGGYIAGEETMSDTELIARAMTVLNNKLEEERKARLHAEKTKAQISDKKTATAMATASAYSRKNKQLEKEKEELAIQIGNSKTYKQVKSIQWLSNYFGAAPVSLLAMIGKSLKNGSISSGYKILEIPDTSYGKVNAYHVDVIEKFKEKLDFDSSFFAKYRIDIF